MSKLTIAWLDAQIERELERGCEPNAIRDLAALVTVRDHLAHGEGVGTFGAMLPMLAAASMPAMRDYNAVSVGEYKDQRGAVIGEEAEEMRQYGRRYDPDRPVTRAVPMGIASAASHTPSAGHLSQEEAEAWVACMEDSEGHKGGRWTLQEIRQYAGNFGVRGEDKAVEFFAVMNALASDYGAVAKKYGVDKVDFWADLAKAFIHDKDAVPDKVKVYYECIAKHGED